MGKWMNRLLEHEHANSETDAPKLTDETDETPQDTPGRGSCVSFVSENTGPHSENTDVHSVIERSAIMEYDGDVSPRMKANMRAAADIDKRRPRYENCHPDGDVAQVEAFYRAYLQDWQPEGPEDIPAAPPNTRDNRPLWVRWWMKVDGRSIL